MPQASPDCQVEYGLRGWRGVETRLNANVPSPKDDSYGVGSLVAEGRPDAGPAFRSDGSWLRWITSVSLIVLALRRRRGQSGRRLESNPGTPIAARFSPARAVGCSRMGHSHRKRGWGGQRARVEDLDTVVTSGFGHGQLRR